MKKILIDISKLHSRALKRGVGVYALNLYKAFKDFENEYEYVLRKADSKNRTGRPDLIHYPYFDLFFLTLPLRGGSAAVITVHDLTPLKFPEHFPAGLRGKIKWQIQKSLLKKADAIIADSQNTKKDIIEVVGYPGERIFPVYLGVGREFKKLKKEERKLAVKRKYKLPDNFLLYVGDLNWNKNLNGLVRPFKKIKSRHQSLKMVLIGSVFADDNLKELQALKKLIKKAKLEKEVIFLGFIPNGDLVAVYNLAVLYVQPSFYEGFGLPVLEAMSCGCPVVCSNQASLPEVGGRAVEYFDPYEKHDLERKLIKLIKDRKRRTQLTELGMVQARKFSWRKTAQETKQVYNRVLKNEI